MPTLIDGFVTSLLTYAIHSFVACAIALAISRLLRQPQDRDLLWKVTLVAPVLTAAFAVALSLSGSHGCFVCGYGHAKGLDSERGLEH